MKIDVEDYAAIRSAVQGQYATVEEMARAYATTVAEIVAIVVDKPLVRTMAPVPSAESIQRSWA